MMPWLYGLRLSDSVKVADASALVATFALEALMPSGKPALRAMLWHLPIFGGFSPSQWISLPDGVSFALHAVGAPDEDANEWCGRDPWYADSPFMLCVIAKREHLNENQLACTEYREVARWSFEGTQWAAWPAEDLRCVFSVGASMVETQAASTVYTQESNAPNTEAV